MISVPLGEVGQGTGHWQVQGLNVSNLAPEVDVWRQTGLLVAKNLVEGDVSVLSQVEIHIPRQDNSYYVRKSCH